MSEEKAEVRSQNVELKPCPFCGCLDVWVTARGAVACRVCGAAGPDVAETREQSARDWNTRAEPDQERAEFARILRGLRSRGLITDEDIARIKTATVTTGSGKKSFPVTGGDPARIGGGPC